MSPFAGEGVNMAFYDAYLLAEALKENDELQMALKEYEDNMYEASEQSARESLLTWKKCLVTMLHKNLEISLIK